MTETTAVKNPAENGGYRYLVMFLLFLVYAFNFLDRQIISILAIPIREELGLDDRQLGLLGGLAFAFLYSTLGVPIAWLADRKNRTWIITGALTLWSGFTALSGFATNFWQLFAARVGVGIGEAGGVAPSYSLIADYFPPKSRARALAVYSLGIPIGSAFGVIAGAQIAGGAISDALDWRSAFIIVGVAGLLIAPIFKIFVREPVRGGLDPVTKKVDPSQIVTKPYRPGFVSACISAYRNVLNVSGRARRSEYWWFTLVVVLLSIPVVIGVQWFGWPVATYWVFTLLTIVPRITLTIRRLHDTGRSGFWFLVDFVPIVGNAYLIYLLVQDSDADNRFGSNPKSEWSNLDLRKVAEPTIADTLSVLVRKPAFWLLSFGAACSSMMGYGVFFWLPSFFARTFDLGIIDTGWLFGTVLFIGGTAGIVLGGVLSDWLGSRSVSAYARVPGIAFLLTTPLYIAGVLAPTPILSLILFLIPTALGLAWLGPALSAFQHLVPASMRTTASSIFLLINNLIGIAGGIYVLGEFSTLLTPSFGDDALRYSIILGSLIYLVAGTLFLIASKRLSKDWEG